MLKSAYRVAQPYFLYQQAAGIVSNISQANDAIRRGDYETAATLLAQTAVTTPHAWASARDSLRLLNALRTMNPQTISNFLAACFAAGTPIVGEHGSKPIERYQVGERVWSRNENDPAAPPQLREIEAIFVTDAPLWHLHMSEARRLATPRSTPTARWRSIRCLASTRSFSNALLWRCRNQLPRLH